MSAVQTQTEPGIMARLRAETRDLHDAAEAHPFQRELAKGRVDRVALGSMVLQQAHLHDALEEALADAAGRDPRVASVASTRRDPREALRADAERLGADLGEPVAASTREVCEEIRASLDVVPVSVLGWVYVIEGSYNGGRFIGMNLARQEAFSDGAGLMALNPHGDEQPQRWAAFKQAMDAADLSEPERDAIVEAARAMFLGVSAMSTEIAER